MLPSEDASADAQRLPSTTSRQSAEAVAETSHSRRQKLKDIGLKLTVIVLMLVTAGALAATPTIYHLVWAR